jgi:hypothetical protein
MSGLDPTMIHGFGLVWILLELISGDQSQTSICIQWFSHFSSLVRRHSTEGVSSLSLSSGRLLLLGASIALVRVPPLM